MSLRSLNFLKCRKDYQFNSSKFHFNITQAVANWAHLILQATSRTTWSTKISLLSKRQRTISTMLHKWNRPTMIRIPFNNRESNHSPIIKFQTILKLPSIPKLYSSLSTCLHNPTCLIVTLRRPSFVQDPQCVVRIRS
jgi:hypothetical protein